MSPQKVEREGIGGHLQGKREGQSQKVERRWGVALSRAREREMRDASLKGGGSFPMLASKGVGPKPMALGLAKLGP